MDFDFSPAPDGVPGIGFALSFASVAGRQQHGLDRPMISRLRAEQCLTGHATVPAGTTASAQVGTGIAFVLDRAVDGPLAADAARAVGYLLPALVILDSKEPAGPAAVVLGGTPRPVDGAALRTAGCLLHRNGQLAATGAGGVLLDSPVQALGRLAEALAAAGQQLQAGQLVVISSITPAVPAEPADRFGVEIAGLGNTSLEMARDGA